LTTYRADIDGLRGIAVAGVVLFHITNRYLPGGFLGVDIFFVISGFLISRIVFESIESGTFSFKDFYLRRVRRLFPALLTVLLVSALVSYFFLEPERLQNFSTSLFFAVFGVSNMYFLFQDSYWADAAETLPLLHTWSLGVEEQFYLLFPITLLLAYRFFKKGRLIFVFVLLGILSFALSFFLANTYPKLLFYSLPTRAWELLVGVIAGLVVSQWNIRPPRIVGAVAVTIGFGIILVSFLYLGQFITGPGMLTTVPVLGAVLVIYGGLTPNIASRMLSLRPLVGLGLISYSLYLWHYPILAFPRGFVGDLPFWLELVAVGISVLAAIVTFFLVEKPFRQRRAGRASTAAMAAGMAGALTFVLVAFVTSGFSTRISGVPVAETPSSVEEREFLNNYSAASGGGERDLLVFGDSHMERLIPSLDSEAQSRGLTVRPSVVNSCYFHLDIVNLDLEENGGGCGIEMQNNRMAWAKSFPPSIAVMGGRLPWYLRSVPFDNGEGGVEEEEFFSLVRPGSEGLSPLRRQIQVKESIGDTAQELLDHGHTVVLIYPIPEVGWNVPDEIFRRGLLQVPAWPLNDPVTTSTQRYFERAASSFDALDAIQGENVVRIYPHTLFCSETSGGRCITHSDTEIYYSDDDHLSTVGNRLLTDWAAAGFSDSGIG
jgi:peptidoglycan/LPS O-acetylase OafA/YrhL